MNSIYGNRKRNLEDLWILYSHFVFKLNCGLVQFEPELVRYIELRKFLEKLDNLGDQKGKELKQLSSHSLNTSNFSCIGIDVTFRLCSLLEVTNSEWVILSQIKHKGKCWTKMV